MIELTLHHSRKDKNDAVSHTLRIDGIEWVQTEIIPAMWYADEAARRAEVLRTAMIMVDRIGERIAEAMERDKQCSKN